MLKQAIAITATLIIFLLLGGIISIYLGQDANWDLKNYHLYNAWAYQNNRLSEDIFTAGTQTYFSPLLDMPYYNMTNHWLNNSPRTVSFIMGLPYGALMFIVFAISWLAAEDSTRNIKKRFLLSAITTAIGVSGVATVSQTGTTFNEIQVAFLTLTGLFFILLAHKSKPSEKIWLLIAISGLFLGAAAGLKLTATVFAVGGALAVLIAPGNMRTKFLRGALFSLAWSFAFLSLWGNWGLSLYDLTGNPFFPIFNSIFQSPWLPPSGGLDTRFLPKDIWQYFLYPFYWANNSQMTVMEPQFSDWRFAIAYTAIFVYGIFFFISKTNQNPTATPERSTPALLTPVLIFATASYTIWLLLFSILRYAVPIESIIGIILLLILQFITKKINTNFLFSKTFFALAIIILMTFLTTSYPNWGRADYSKEAFEISAPKIPNNSLIIFADKPLAYLAPFLAKNVHNIAFIGATHDANLSEKYKLGQLIHHKIKKWDEPIFAVSRNIDSSFFNTLENLSLKQVGSCHEISSNIDSNASICRVEKK